MHIAEGAVNSASLADSLKIKVKDQKEDGGIQSNSASSAGGVDGDAVIPDIVQRDLRDTVIAETRSATPVTVEIPTMGHSWFGEPSSLSSLLPPALLPYSDHLQISATLLCIILLLRYE